MALGSSSLALPVGSGRSQAELWGRGGMSSLPGPPPDPGLFQALLAHLPLQPLARSRAWPGLATQPGTLRGAGGAPSARGAAPAGAAGNGAFHLSEFKKKKSSHLIKSVDIVPGHPARQRTWL